MTQTRTPTTGRRRADRASGVGRVTPPSAERRRVRRRLGRTSLGAATGALLLVVGIAVAPPEPAVAVAVEEVGTPQGFEVPAAVAPAAVHRDAVDATAGIESFRSGGTNEDWAKLVMVYGGFPVSESNVTVMMRWMRQENYEKNWFQRNNPLNNGQGSGGGSGLGSYPDLDIAAFYAAQNITSGRYPDIAAGFAASAPTDQIERAIWVSPWASSHYQNGAHWHYHPYDVVPAPASAWPAADAAPATERIAG